MHRECATSFLSSTLILIPAGSRRPVGTVIWKMRRLILPLISASEMAVTTCPLEATDWNCTLQISFSSCLEQTLNQPLAGQVLPGRRQGKRSRLPEPSPQALLSGGGFAYSWSFEKRPLRSWLVWYSLPALWNCHQPGSPDPLVADATFDTTILAATWPYRSVPPLCTQTVVFPAGDAKKCACVLTS